MPDTTPHVDGAALEIRAGAELPGGTYRLGADRHDRLVAALGGGAPADGSAHPLAAWLIAMGGSGVSLADLFAAAGVPMETGPMLGACELELARPLGIETPYAVRGGILDVEAKTGRRLGRFDVLRIRLEVREPDGAAAAACIVSMILPRGGAGT